MKPLAILLAWSTLTLAGVGLLVQGLKAMTARALAILATALIVATCLAVAYALQRAVSAHPIDSATVTLLYGCYAALVWIAGHGILRAWFRGVRR